MRGTPDISKAIFNKVRAITENNNPIDKPSRPKITNEGGAYNSINKRRLSYDNNGNIQSTPFGTKPSDFGGLPNKPAKTEPLLENSNVAGYFDSLNESMALLKETKEYSSVVRGLLTYYLAGKLDKTIFEGLDMEDRMEIFGIIKDFESTVKVALK